MSDAPKEVTDDWLLGELIKFSNPLVYKDEWHTNVHRALYELKRRRASDRWIPVSERLPEAKGHVLIARAEPRRPEWPPMTSIAYFRGGKDFFVGQTERAENVLAWRPLPPPFDSSIAASKEGE
jgi:hypothetical protein